MGRGGKGKKEEGEAEEKEGMGEPALPIKTSFPRPCMSYGEK